MVEPRFIKNDVHSNFVMLKYGGWGEPIYNLGSAGWLLAAVIFNLLILSVTDSLDHTLLQYHSHHNSDLYDGPLGMDRCYVLHATAAEASNMLTS